jgi:hypothetical protein
MFVCMYVYMYICMYVCVCVCVCVCVYIYIYIYIYICRNQVLHVGIKHKDAVKTLTNCTNETSSVQHET